MYIMAVSSSIDRVRLLFLLICTAITVHSQTPAPTSAETTTPAPTTTAVQTPDPTTIPENTGRDLKYDHDNSSQNMSKVVNIFYLE